ncbi:MAG TPA: hypothetical protein VN759_01760 [Pseudolysinimonas sp.]|nr:hypothetical protein [Pseudolysinimonas sp.]
MIGLVAVAVVLVILIGMFVLGSHVRRHPEQRGSGAPGSGLMGAAFDNAFHPSAAIAREALDEQQRIVAPAPTPDGDRGIAGNRIRLGS